MDQLGAKLGIRQEKVDAGQVLLDLLQDPFASQASLSSSNSHHSHSQSSHTTV